MIETLESSSANEVFETDVHIYLGPQTIGI